MDIVEAVYARLSPRVFPIAQERLRASIVDMVKFQAEKIGPLTPLRRQMLIDRIVQKFLMSMAPEHDPVGVNAALTTGENLVQSSLSAKHTAGIKRGATGFDRIEEITNMKNSSDIVKVITTALNGVPRSKEEINELANIIIRIDLQDIASRYEIVTAEVGTTPILQRLPRWYTVFASIYPNIIASLQDTWLRIHIDARLMYKHRISLPEIAGNLQEDLANAGIIAYPPSSVGTYLDIHVPGDISLAQKYTRLASLMALQVGGINTVESAYPIFENLLTNLRVNEVGNNEFELSSSAPPYIPTYVWEQMIRAMVPDAEPVGSSGRRFFSSYTYNDLQRMILEFPLMYGDVLESRVEQDGVITLRFREYIDVNGNSVPLVDYYPYLQYADLTPVTFTNTEEADNFLLENMVEMHLYWYIEAVCSTVQDLFVLPEVDSTRTFTTSPIDCMKSLGYLAMRQMLYTDFRDNISVDPTHIKVIINNMTQYREPVSIRRQSLKNDKSEFLTYTTFEDILKYIMAAAFAGETDHMQSVSAKILSGAQINIGRGGVNLPPVTPTNPTGNRFLALVQSRERQEARPRRTTRRPAAPSN